MRPIRGLVCQSVCQLVCQSVNLSVCRSVGLSVYWFIISNQARDIRVLLLFITGYACSSVTRSCSISQSGMLQAIICITLAQFFVSTLRWIYKDIFVGLFFNKEAMSVCPLGGWVVGWSVGPWVRGSVGPWVRGSVSPQLFSTSLSII